MKWIGSYRTRLTAAASALALVTACSAVPSAGGGGAGTPAPGNPGQGTGPGIFVEDALRSTSQEPLLVRGAVVATREEVRLCSALAESYPPQCGGPSLKVEGLDLSTVEGLKSHAGVRWTETEIKLLGHVRNGVLTIAANSQG